MACGTVTGEINYLKRLDLYQKEKPFQLFIPVDENGPGPRSSNLEFEMKEQTFVDIRENLRDFSLDTHGFEVGMRPTALAPADFHSRDTVETRYFEEVKDILKNIDGGYDEIFIFDHRLRDAAVPKEEVLLDMNDLAQWLRPSPNVHIDQSPRAVVHRILLHLPEDGPYLLQGRVRVVNVWRPIENPVESYPLAFCDPRTAGETDLIECDHVRRKFKGANMYMHHSPGQKWYYLGNQQPEEYLLLKMFDSDSTVEAKAVPHASFHHPLSTPQSRPRKSIEVRALVFNYPPEE
ncbi:methyltransferase CmcJ [Immersiella caudata]|uniref:Methyltransferase CmcJ n=1 Tax=Immersiella caudata TaxID=314043 RepID=A0AA40BU23_9PEZI|nr:methyltransferase CmcJ [Immersiella caudata]